MREAAPTPPLAFASQVMLANLVNSALALELNQRGSFMLLLCVLELHERSVAILLMC
jgi:hypothetical protein